MQNFNYKKMRHLSLVSVWRNLTLTVFVILFHVFSTKAQTIVNFYSAWYNTYSENLGSFKRAIIDENDLVISGSTWPSYPLGALDQMITKVNHNGGIDFQITRTPGPHHDEYVAVIKMINGNFGFFGAQFGQGTQCDDVFFTEFDNFGNEISYNFFANPDCYASGSDMLALPNDNIICTGTTGSGYNFIAITDQQFNQLNYQLTNGGSYEAQLAIDTINNRIYSITDGVNSVVIDKFDFSLNSISTYEINHNDTISNYDAIIDGTDLLLCGFKVIDELRYGTFYRINSNGTIIDSYIDEENSEYTAIAKYGSDVVLAKSNLTANGSVPNEIFIYRGSGVLGENFALNSGSSFRPYDLILNGDTLYAVGCQNSQKWFGTPAIEKIIIQTCSGIIDIDPISQETNVNNNAQFIIHSSDPNAYFQWQTDIGVGFQNLNNVGQYSGATNDTLNISYVNLINDNQAFRCLVSSGICTDTSEVAFLSVINNVWVEILDNEGDFSVYPNPANKTIQLQVDPGSIGEFYFLYNYQGQLVVTEKIKSMLSTIEIENEKSGLFFLNIGNNNKKILIFNN